MSLKEDIEALRDDIIKVVIKKDASAHGVPALRIEVITEANGTKYRHEVMFSKKLHIDDANMLKIISSMLTDWEKKL